MSDLVIRGIAAVAALVLVCAPAAPLVVAWIRSHADQIRKATRNWPTIVLACGLGWVAMFGVPQLPVGGPSVPPVVVPTPSPAMQAAVADVQRAFANANPVDRLAWGHLFAKAGAVVAGDATDTEVVFTDTRGLRAYTVIALRIGWRRLGENAVGKYPGLKEATERAFASLLGMDVQPVTPELRARYVELCQALAWASLPPRG